MTNVFFNTAIQSLFPTVLRVIDQIIEAGILAGARQLFDVLDNLLVLICPIFTWSNAT